MMRYVRFVVPDFIEGDNYDFELMLSTTANFSNPATLKISTDSSKFSIFKDNTWKSFSSLNKTKIVSTDKNASIKVDIKSVLDQKGNTFYVKYRWTNNSTNPATHSEWKGAVLGSYAYYNEKFEDAAVLANIASFKIEGTVNANENGTGTYNMYKVDKNGNSTSVTASAEFTSLYGNSFTNNVCTFNAPINEDVVDVIKGTYTLNGVSYYAYFDVLVKSKTLEKIVITDLPNEMTNGDTATFKVSAFYSDNTSANVTTSATISRFPTDYIGLTGNTITANNTFDLFGTLQASYTYKQKTCTEIRYIHLNRDKFVSLSASITINGASGTYIVTGTKKNGGTVNVTTAAPTSTSGLNVSLINGAGVTFNNGNITIDSSKFYGSKEVTAIFKYKENRQNDEVICVNTFTVTSTASAPASTATTQHIVGLKDFDVVFKQNNNNVTEVFEGTSFTYHISSVTNTDGTTISIGNDADTQYKYQIFKCSSDAAISSMPTSAIQSSNVSGTIGLNSAFHTNENVVFKFRVTYKGLVYDRLFTIHVKPIYPTNITIEPDNNDYNVQAKVTKNVNIKAVYSNGTVKQPSATQSNRTVTIAAGDPNLLSSVLLNADNFTLKDNASNGKLNLTFNNPSNDKLKETITFLVEYTDPDFVEETLTKMFTMVVTKAQ